MRGLGCGETSERTAARAHEWATLIMGLCVTIEVAAVVIHVVMCAFHRSSTAIHAARALAKGE